MLCFILFLKKYLFSTQKMVLKANIYNIFILFSLFYLFFMCFICVTLKITLIFIISLSFSHILLSLFILAKDIFSKIFNIVLQFLLYFILWKNIFNTQKMAIKINSYYISILFLLFSIFSLCVHLQYSRDDVNFTIFTLSFLHNLFSLFVVYLFYKIYGNICESEKLFIYYYLCIFYELNIILAFYCLLLVVKSVFKH